MNGCIHSRKLCGLHHKDESFLNVLNVIELSKTDGTLLINLLIN